MAGFFTRKIMQVDNGAAKFRSPKEAEVKKKKKKGLALINHDSILLMTAEDESFTRIVRRQAVSTCQSK
jgi:hypothetical protein